MRNFNEYPLIVRLISQAVEASRDAANILREFKRGGNLEAKQMHLEHTLTDADRASYESIMNVLNVEFSHLKYISDEEDMIRVKTDPPSNPESKYNIDVLLAAEEVKDTWSENFDMKAEDILVWIDSLDGSGEYSKGNKMLHEVTILIGVSYQGRPIAGVINQPFYSKRLSDKNGDRVIWGIKGIGAYCYTFDENNTLKTKIGRPDSNNVKEKTIVLTSRTHLNDIVLKTLKNIPNSEIKYIGGSGYKALLLIEGKGDCYFFPRFGTKRWDTAAAEGILASISETAKMTNAFNEQYSYSDDKHEIENSLGIIASFNSHEVYINALDESDRNAIREEANQIFEKQKELQLRNIMRGDFKNLPKKISSTVSIFLSSTFTDMHEERDYLIQNVYPKLKSFCKGNYNLDFQIIDMRWGVKSSENHINNITTFCINQVRRCNQSSAKPTFIALIGHRYGTVFLPTRIEAAEFEVLKEEMKTLHKKGVINLDYDKLPILKTNDIASHCYRKDENKSDKRYILQNMPLIIENFKADNPEHMDVWKDIQVRLKDIFTKASEECLKKRVPLSNDKKNPKYYDQERAERYKASVTDKEIFNGIFKPKLPNAKSAPFDVKDTTLVFFREIDGIYDIVDELHRCVDIKPEEKQKKLTLLKKFVDLKDDQTLDRDKIVMLDELTRRLKNRYKDSEYNFETYKVSWEENGGVTRKAHPFYMKKFGDDFFDKVKTLIKRNADRKIKFDILPKSSANRAGYNEFINELMYHTYFWSNNTKDSIENEERNERFIKPLVNYITSINNKPFIVYGATGSGKTSLIANLINEIYKYEYITQIEKNIVILRFLGITANSSKIVTVLKHICIQLDELYKNWNVLSVDSTAPSSGIDLESDMDAIQIRDHFLEKINLLGTHHPDYRIIIVLDSLERLSELDLKFEWLPITFPDNLKIIMSTSDTKIAGKLNKITHYGKSNLYYIENLDHQSAENMLHNLRKAEDYTLIPEQDEAVKNVVGKSKDNLNPLYIKLINYITNKWKSYDPVNEEFMKCINIDTCINYFFDSLEIQFLTNVVKRCFFYMTFTEYGISDKELEDVLSLDNDILQEVYEHHIPDTQQLHFPSALWFTIKYEIEEFIFTKETDDTLCNFWYHKCFSERSRSRYVDSVSLSDRDNYILNFIYVFTEKYKDAPKIIKIGQKDVNKRRDTAPQPTRYENGLFNKRKLNLVPILCSSIYDPIQRSRITIDNIFMNYDFLYAKFELGFEVSHYMGSSTNIEEQLNELITTHGQPNSYIILVATLIKIICLWNETSLSDYPQSFALQITSSILGLYGLSKEFTRFIDECDQKSPQQCALIAPYQILPLSKVKMELLIHYKTRIKNVEFCELRNFMLCDKNKIKIYEYNPTNMSNKNNYDDIRLQSIQPLNPDYDYFKIKIIDNTKKFTDVKIVASSKKNVIILGANDKEIKEIREKQEHTIKNIFLIGNRAVLILYAKKPYFDIYDLKEAQCISREPINWKTTTNSSNHIISDLIVESHYEDRCIKEGGKDKGKGTYIAYYSNTSNNKSVLIIVEAYLKESDSKRLYLYSNTRYKMPFDCHIQSIALSTPKEDSDDGISLVATFSNNTLLLIKYNSLRDVTTKRFKTAFECEPNKGFKIKEYSNDIVSLIDCYDRYHIYDTKYEKWATIGSKIDYEFGIIKTSWNDDHLFIYTINKNLFDVYIMKRSGNQNYDIGHLVYGYQFEHNVVDIDIKENHVLVVFDNGILTELNLNSMVIAKKQQSQITRIKQQIDAMVPWDQDIIVAYSKANNTASSVSGWRRSTGELLFDNLKEVTNMTIHHVLKCNEYLFVCGSTEIQSQVIIYRDITEIENIDLEYVQKVTLPSKFTQEIIKVNEIRNELIILNYKNDENTVTMGSIKNTGEDWIYESKSEHKLRNYFEDSNLNDDKKIFNICITNRKEYFAILSNNSVVYLHNHDIIGSGSFPEAIITIKNNQNPSEKLTMLPIANRDDILVMNKKHIYYIFFDKKKSKLGLNPISIKDVSPEKNAKFHSCKLQGHRLIVCFRGSEKLTRSKRKISVFDLDPKIIFKEEEIDEALRPLRFINESVEGYEKYLPISVDERKAISIEFQHDLNDYCLTSDGNYVVVHYTEEIQQTLILYRLRDQEEIARVPLFSDVNCIQATDTFISLGLKEKRVISYLIIDPVESEHKNRIKTLDSRNKKLKERKDSIEDVLNTFYQYFYAKETFNWELIFSEATNEGENHKRDQDHDKTKDIFIRAAEIMKDKTKFVKTLQNEAALYFNKTKKVKTFETIKDIKEEE